MATWIGHRIKEAREEAGLTQEQIAPRVGISLSSYCRYEQGVTEPSVKRLQQIATATGKPLSFFFTDVPDEVPA